MSHAGCSIVAIVMRSKSGQCWEPEKETYSESGTSAGSEMTSLKDPSPIGRSDRSKEKLNGRRPQRVSARQLAIADRVLQLRRK